MSTLFYFDCIFNFFLHTELHKEMQTHSMTITTLHLMPLKHVKRKLELKKENLTVGRTRFPHTHISAWKSKPILLQLYITD